MSLPEQLQQSDRLDPPVWKITSVAVIGSFLSQLDATVVNVSLTAIQEIPITAGPEHPDNPVEVRLVNLILHKRHSVSGLGRRYS
jgi:hypothetical protein